MAGKKSKEVRASQANEVANEMVGESAHEQVVEGVTDREDRGATRTNLGATIRLEGGAANREAGGVVTRSRDNALNPPHNVTANRSQGGAASHQPRSTVIQIDDQSTTRPGKEPMAHSYHPGPSA